jgi:DNA oxidative demethylase
VKCVRNQLHSGFDFYPAYLDRAAQEALLATLAPLIERAPFYRPTMPKTGKAFSVQMTNLGPLGWVSDREGGYRYQATHPCYRPSVARYSASRFSTSGRR